MSPVRAVRSCLRQYAGFSGRAPRSEYWWWCVFWLAACLLVQVVFYLPYAAISDSVVLPANVPFTVSLVAGFLPLLSVTVRRLHDGDWSGWWAALLMLPCVYVVWPEALGGDIGADRAIGFIVFDYVFLAAYLLLAIRLCLSGTGGTNRFGPDPLGSGLPEDGRSGPVTPPTDGGPKPPPRDRPRGEPQ